MALLDLVDVVATAPVPLPTLRHRHGVVLVGRVLRAGPRLLHFQGFLPHFRRRLVALPRGSLRHFLLFLRLRLIQFDLLRQFWRIHPKLILILLPELVDLLLQLVQLRLDHLLLLDFLLQLQDLLLLFQLRFDLTRGLLLMRFPLHQSRCGIRGVIIIPGNH